MKLLLCVFFCFIPSVLATRKYHYQRTDASDAYGKDIFDLKTLFVKSAQKVRFRSEKPRSKKLRNLFPFIYLLVTPYQGAILNVGVLVLRVRKCLSAAEAVLIRNLVTGRLSSHRDNTRDPCYTIAKAFTTYYTLILCYTNLCCT